MEGRSGKRRGREQRMLGRDGEGRGGWGEKKKKRGRERRKKIQGCFFFSFDSSLKAFLILNTYFENGRCLHNDELSLMSFSMASFILHFQFYLVIFFSAFFHSLLTQETA